jgi:hypothetical protein
LFVLVPRAIWYAQASQLTQNASSLSAMIIGTGYRRRHMSLIAKSGR